MMEHRHTWKLLGKFETMPLAVEINFYIALLLYILSAPQPFILFCILNFIFLFSIISSITFRA